MPAPTVPLAPDVRQFLTEALRFATIATIGADGTPHLAVVWYLIDDEGVLINSLVGRRWPRELQRDPRVALTVVDPEIGPERTVTIQGEAVVSDTGAEALGDIQALSQRYGFGDGDFAGQERISFRIRPRVVTHHGDL
ncbi:MAG: PPOX class F420-dependent oxidoreductase [Candidatus Limnocylindrales bacterium]